MLSSITSNNKDVLVLIPVPKITAKDLHQMILKMIVNVTNVRYQRVNITSDNNGINKIR